MADMMSSKQSLDFSQVIKEAEQYIAGGVVSLNRKVSPHIIFEKGKGSRIFDINGNDYIDYHAAFAPHLLGHNNEQINRSVVEAIQGDYSLIGSGTNSLEIRLAKLLCQSVSSLDLVQITNTGSEATAHAIRLSRAFTGREHVVLILGGYNGWHNDVAREVMPALSKVGKRISPGEYPFFPSSAGIPLSVMQKVHCINFNDLESLEFVLKTYPVACILAEPVMQNVGVVLPEEGYLKSMLELCERYGTVCIFDEVKTGFRSALGGYQQVSGVTPHLSVFGKAVANGYPLGVVGGKREIMEQFDAPDAAKRVLVAGTYNAHPFNTVAAISTLEILQDPEIYEHLDKMTRMLCEGLSEQFAEKGIPVSIQRNASAFCVYFMENRPGDLHDILENHDFNTDLTYRRAMIGKGIYFLPVACKQCSVSYAHSTSDIAETLDKSRTVLRSI